MRFIALFFILAAFTNAHARWAAKEDFDRAVESQNNTFVVNSDGSYTAVIENQIKILKEEGKHTAGIQRIFYSADSSKVTVLEAKTVNPSGTYAVKREMIEDKNVATEKNGFSQLHQVMVAFPQVEVGSIIDIKYKMEVKKGIVPGLFSMEFGYGIGMYEAGGKTEIISALPLKFYKNDPDQYLEVIEAQAAGKHKLTITLKKPAFKKVLDESAPTLEASAFPSVEVSTTDDWGVISKAMNVGFEKSLKGKIPAEFSQILAEARLKKTLEEKITVITSKVRSMINYIGDWRTQAGALAPRSLDEIAKTHYGDCKDYSTITTALLRDLGIKADVALVFAKAPPNPAVPTYGLPSYLPAALPSTSAFNHAIVKVSEEGKTYWLDPTNSPAYFSIVPTGIAGQDALVVTDKPVKPEKIKSREPKESTEEITQYVSLKNPALIEGEGKLKYTGSRAAAILEVGDKIASDKLDSVFAVVTAGTNHLDWSHVEKYDLTSKALRDLEFEIKYNNKTVQPAAGAEGVLSYSLPIDAAIGALLTDPQKRVSDMMIGYPEKIERRITLTNLEVVSELPSPCLILSPWANISRKVDVGEQGLSVVSKIEFRKESITNVELKSDEYSIFLMNMRRCYSDVNISYKPLPNETVKVAVVPQSKRSPAAAKAKAYEDTEDEDPSFAANIKRHMKHRFASLFALYEKYTKGETKVDPKVDGAVAAATDLLDNDVGDDRLLLKAISLLEKKKAEGNAEAYVQTARAIYKLGYLNARTYSPEHLKVAKENVEKALEIDPKSTNAHVVLGYIQFYEKKYDEASKNANEAIRLSGDIAEPYILLGGIAKEQHKKDDGVTALTEALKHNPNRGQKDKIYNDLGMLYSDAKEYAKSEDAYKKALQNNPDRAWTHYNYSLALYEDGNYDEAIDECSRALEISDFGAAKTHLTNILYKKSRQLFWDQKQPEKGLPYLEKVLAKDPSHADANFDMAIYHYRLATEQHQTEHFEKAREHALRAIASNPKNDQAKQMVQYIEGLKR